MQWFHGGLFAGTINMDIPKLLSKNTVIIEDNADVMETSYFG